MMVRSAIALPLLALLLSAPAGAVAAEEPSLAITISNGVDDARVGDILDYTVTVENRGGEMFDGIVTVTPPPNLTLSSSEASETNGALSFDVSLPPGGSSEVRAIGTVGETLDADVYQVVVTAAVAAVSAPGEILVRAADADRIPGSEAPAPVPGMTDPVQPSLLPWIVGSSIALVVLGVAVGLVVWFRRRQRLSS